MAPQAAGLAAMGFKLQWCVEALAASDDGDPNAAAAWLFSVAPTEAQAAG